MVKVLISDKMSPLAADVFKSRGIEVDVITDMDKDTLAKKIGGYDGIAESCATAKPVVDMLWWTFHDPSAAKTATELNYAPVPAKALAPIEKTLKGLKCEGKAILPQS